MNTSDLKKIIKELVAEEVQKQLSKILVEMIGNKNSNQSNRFVNEDVNEQSPYHNVNQEAPRRSQQPRNNSILSQIMSDTVSNNDSTGPIVYDDNMVNENVNYNTPNESGNSGVNLQNKLFNKNLKAIVDKSKSSHLSGRYSNILQNW